MDMDVISLKSFPDLPTPKLLALVVGQYLIPYFLSYISALVFCFVVTMLLLLLLLSRFSRVRLYVTP